MSRVYFHSPSGEAELRGSERSHAGLVVKEIAGGVIAPAHRHERLRELINPEHSMARKDTVSVGWLPEWAFWFTTCLGGDDWTTPLLTYAGRPIRTFDLILNTALAVGSEPVKFLARLDGQCEHHAYVEGPNRAWLADIIEQGLGDGVMRRSLKVQPHPNVPREAWPTHDLGWDGVIEFLRARDDEPVVMSYSVEGGFPNPGIGGPGKSPMPEGWHPEGWSEAEWSEVDDEMRAEYWDAHLSDQWYDQTAGVKWEQGMAGLRVRNETALLELKPDDWASYRFGHCLSAYDLYADDWRERIEQALGIEPLPAPDLTRTEITE